MLYSFLEMGRAAMMPWRAAANATRQALRNPLNPMADTLAGRAMAASADVFESLTRYYGKPDWGFETVEVGGEAVPLAIETVWSKPFCDLIHFRRDREALAAARKTSSGQGDPKVLFVAPMSGHYATLLRGTVETFLPDCEVYVTDWADARRVPVIEGRFDLDDFVQYVREMIAAIGPDVHVVAVCQPGPPTLAAVSLMAEDGDENRPLSMTFMGSPIDARKSPTVPNKLAEERPYSWFRDQLIHTVPAVYPGALRRVYPGFMQLTGFINMNWDRHVDAHWRFFQHLVEGDGDSADRHRAFYDEYLSVMDLTEEFYLQTISDVFQQHKLPNGTMTVKGRPVRPAAIADVALLTVEGENDDISGIGQTQAAHTLCTGLSDALRQDHIQPGVGHYGVFNGRRFREEIAPMMKAFMKRHATRKTGKRAA
ncbi:polyhydroxyalkanoate depolymerase [Marinicauda algicola]|uniref:Polyhydroxyalkanoate depolymerase n=1 Tax=Marinicauda algicola TaxID=2029849 RepID=A0A4S2H130_9PROT|nr:polyhydroxyalkanoate depolymerase [Marinicauda algicola]TGY88961.1 polyhydroxyalkanoate depolymerase [Marinicauda algicola]